MKKVPTPIEITTRAARIRSRWTAEREMEARSAVKDGSNQTDIPHQQRITDVRKPLGG